MAQYFTDFSEYTSDVFPSDWTSDDRNGGEYTVNVRSDALAVGGKWLEIKPTSLSTKVAWYLLAWNKVDADANRADAEIEFRYQIVGSAAVNDHDIYAMARAANIGTNNRDFYSFGNRFGGRVAIAETIANSLTFIAVGDDTISSSTWYRINARINGTNLIVTQWLDSDPKPATPDLSVSSSAITEPGSVGINLFSSIDGDIIVDWFGVGTNGDPAPTEPVGGGGEFISELTPRTETSQVQPLALSAGSTQSLTPSSSTAQTVNLFMVAGNSQSADPITDNSKTQLQQLISGLSVALLPESDTSATQELGFIGGVKDDLIVALVPAADTSALQEFQVRLGQLQQATPEADSSALMTLNLVAGTSVPFSSALSPGVDSAALQAQGFVSGFNAQSEPATDTQGTVTLDERSGQVISLEPAIESSITQTLGLFTGVVIGKFTRSSVLDLSPQYSVSELSTAYDIIEQTPVYSVKEI